LKNRKKTPPMWVTTTVGFVEVGRSKSRRNDEEGQVGKYEAPVNKFKRKLSGEGRKL